MTTVLHLKSNKYTNQVYIYTSSGGVYVLFIDDVVKLGLRPGHEIASIENMEQKSYHFLLREYALRQIAMSPKNRQILSQKTLQKYKYIKTKYKYVSTFDITNILDELEEKKLLDSASYAQYLARKYKSKSTQYIKQKMLMSKVDSEIIKDTLSNLNPQDQVDQIKKLVQKLLKKHQLMPKNKQYQKILSSLYQKGFPISSVKEILDQESPNSYNS